MTRRAIFPFVIGSVVTAGLAGCQSASRWAWWKNQDDRASTVAQSSAPALPSSGATPQAIDVPGLEPASSPSAANLAAAQSPSSAPSVSLPASSASTIANAPLANYSPAGTTATAGSPNTSVSAPGTTTASSAIASVPPSGPYDPYGYKAGNSYAAATATTYDAPAGNPLRSSAPMTDRYPMPAASTTPAINSQYASAAAPASAETATGAFDKYALPSVTAQTMPDSNVNNSAAAYPAVSSPAAAAFANPPTPSASQAVSAVESSTPSTTAASPIVVTPVTATNVQLPAAGKYRPGGTSDYSTTTESQHVEVAALPASPQPAPPAGASDAWSTPASAAPAASGDIGTY